MNARARSMLRGLMFARWRVIAAAVALGFPIGGGFSRAAAAETIDPSSTVSETGGDGTLTLRGSTNFSDMGAWIWETNTFDRQTVRFWKSFQIPHASRVSRARLRITGDNEYTLFLDGRELGRDAEWRHLYEYDITALLKPGKHVLGVEVYNSFNEAGMVMGLRVDLENKQVIEVKSDASWLIVSGKLHDWTKRLEPDESWHTATVVAGFGEKPWGVVDFIDLVPPLQPVIIPFWQTGWFQIALLTACGGVSLISLRLMAQVMLHKKEKELLRRERARIARDIHDDLGLRVTRFVLQGEVAQSELPAGSETRVQFEKMCEEGREALRAMDEVLWAINPRRDTLREFVTYVCRYAQTFLQATPIQCVLEVEPEMSSAAFDLPLRRNLLMAVKEALNNAVKHSEATELLLKIHWENKKLLLVVEDNGRGFTPSMANPERNGLSNMAQRMAEVGGDFRLASQPGNGCRVEFVIPLIHSRPRFSWFAWRGAARPPTESSSAKSVARPADTPENEYDEKHRTQP